MSETTSLPSFAALPANGIVSLKLENAGQTLLSGGITTFGQVFQQGEMPAGAGLVATVAGNAAGVQMDVKSTYPDGSVKFAVLSVERPDIGPGSAVDVVLSRGTPMGSAGIDLTSALAGHSFSVDIVGAGGTTHVDVLQALSNALANGTASVWQQGVLATQARVEIELAGSQRLVFDVTAFKGGGFEVEAQFNNDRAMEAVGGRVAYTAIATMDGREVAREALDQGQYQNWHETFSSNNRDGGQGLGDPAHGWLNIQQDTRHLEATGAISPYNFSQGVAESKLAAWYAATQQAGWGDPFAANGLVKYMPTTGGRDDIGITTAANTGWILTQDARAAAYAMGQAEAASGIPWNFWDAAHDTWLSTDFYPRMWVNADSPGTGTAGDPSATALSQRVPTDTGWKPETAHQPNLSYVPYLLTGERWILDNLNAEAAWTVVAAYPGNRNDAQDILANFEQVRAAAWSLREVQGASFANPDGSVEKAYFDAVAGANWSWLVSQIPVWTEQQGEAHGWIPRDSSNALLLAPWQQDYFASVTIMAARQGNADALTFLEWQANFLIGRFTHAAEGFNPHDGAGYTLLVGDLATGTLYKTWEEIGAATVAAGWSLGDGWGQNDYPQLALATLAGIYELTGSAQAAKAYWALVAMAPPLVSSGDYASMPTNAFVPPPRDGQVVVTPPTEAGSVSAGDTITGTAGNDTLRGTSGHDSILGAAGHDSLIGGSGRDTLLGGAGNDTLDGGSGNDHLYGGAGNDTYRVDSAQDVIIEATNAGDDLVIAGLSWTLGANIERLTLVGTGDFAGTGNALDNWIEGNSGNNLLLGGAGNDTLIGGAGADTLYGIPGSDSMVGGAGDDVYYVDDQTDRVVEAPGEGTDLVFSTSSFVLPTNVENLTIGGTAALTGTGNALANAIAGNTAGNLISGLDGNDVLRGMGGADTLLGGNGDDVLNGGVGADSMVGGAGNDAYYVDNALDRVVELDGGGTDRVIATISYTLGANVENLTLSGLRDINGSGNTLANTITGNGANNALSGLGGNDVLLGGAGRDTLMGGDGNDNLQGQDGNDVLGGGSGFDLLTGGVGADIFHFGSAGTDWDTIVDFAPGSDHIEVLRSGFGNALPAGTLADAAFTIGTLAVGTGAQFIYNTTSGVLRWDPDGTGSAGSVAVAVLTGAPTLHASDITLVNSISAASHDAIFSS